MTGRVAVGDLGCHGRVLQLAIEGRDVIEGSGIQVCHGYGMTYPSPFTGAFAHDGRVWIQAGRDRWDAATVAEVRQVEESLRTARYRLVFHDRSHQDIAVRFPPGVIAHKLIDPTYDEISSWADDPMKLLPYISADGGRRVTPTSPPGRSGCSSSGRWGSPSATDPLRTGQTLKRNFSPPGADLG